MSRLPSREITTVLLDADGVIQTSGTAFLSSIEMLCPDPSKRTDFVSDVFEAERPCLTGDGDFPNALGAVLRRWNVEAPLSDALALWSQIDPAPKMLEVVQKLRHAGIRVGLASNQQAHRANLMSTVLDYSSLFDNLFFSCHIGSAKPDAGFFAAVLDKLQVSGERVLFVDDHLKNVQGAQYVGICGEVYHLDYGFGRFRSILKAHHLDVA